MFRSNEWSIKFLVKKDWNILIRRFLPYKTSNSKSNFSGALMHKFLMWIELQKFSKLTEPWNLSFAMVLLSFNCFNISKRFSFHKPLRLWIAGTLIDQLWPNFFHVIDKIWNAFPSFVFQMHHLQSLHLQSAQVQLPHGACGQRGLSRLENLSLLHPLLFLL